MSPTFPAKLLLFGEHIVNLGSHALAMPLPMFSGKWAYAPQLSPSELAARQQQLPQFADYLDDLQERGELLLKLDIKAFKEALAKGLVFESKIPVGYGAGSSGALVAGVVSEFGLLAPSEQLDFREPPVSVWGTGMSELKKALAQMEAFFHGTSSGTDPLVCYLQKPVLLGGEEGVQIVELPSSIQPIAVGDVPKNGSYTIFLLDTGIKRSATPMIEYFLKKTKGPTSRPRVHHTLIPEVQQAIERFLKGDSAGVYEQMLAISHFQFNYLKGLVPKPFHGIWKRGLETKLFKLKVCGAGGGGFIIGMTKEWAGTKAALANYKLVPVLSM